MSLLHASFISQVLRAQRQPHWYLRYFICRMEDQLRIKGPWKMDFAHGVWKPLKNDPIHEIRTWEYFGYFSNIVFAFDSSDTKIAGLASKAIDVTQSFAALSWKCVHYDIRGLSNIWVTQRERVFVLIACFLLLESLLENVWEGFSNGILSVR